MNPQAAGPAAPAAAPENGNAGADANNNAVPPVQAAPEVLPEANAPAGGEPQQAPPAINAAPAAAEQPVAVPIQAANNAAANDPAAQGPNPPGPEGAPALPQGGAEAARAAAGHVVIEVRDGGDRPVNPNNPDAPEAGAPPHPVGGADPPDVVINIPDPDPGAWWIDDHNDLLRGNLPTWDFSYHDAPTQNRGWYQTLALWASFIPLLGVMGLTVISSPGLLSFTLLFAILCASAAMRATEVEAKRMAQICLESLRAAWGSTRDCYTAGPWVRTDRRYFGCPKSYPNWLGACMGLFTVVLFTSISTGVLVCAAFYIYVLFKAASLIFWLENAIYLHVLPNWFWTLAAQCPRALVDLFLWLSWAKYLYMTFEGCRHSLTYLALCTRMTRIRFRGFELEHDPEDARAWTFRNQELEGAAMPIRIELSRSMFYFLMTFREERVVSASMLMELTSHKFCNGTSSLSDTFERIDRAFKTTGYLNIRQDDIFLSRDSAECARIIAHHWAKHRQEANAGLLVQNF